MAENMKKEKMEQTDEIKNIKKSEDKQKKKHKKRFSIYTFLGKVGDILLIPIMVVALISSISMLANRSQNKPTSFMGNYLVTIQSGSMKNDGFLVGDTVLTRKTQGKDLKLGDVIAFYNYKDNSDPNLVDLSLVVRYNITSGLGLDMSESNIVRGNVNLDNIEYKKVEYNKTVKDAQVANTKINFHRIVAIYVDESNGTFYFRTKGSNNNSVDTYTIRQDFVVGKYINTPRTIRDIVKFCASTFGMIVLVCIPLSLQVLLQCLSLIEQIGIINNERALLRGRVTFKDEEFRKDFDGNQMELYNKVYYFYLIPKEDRSFTKECMWSNILYKEKLSKKESVILNTIDISEPKLDTNEDGYWNDWIDNTRGYDRRKIYKQYHKLITDNIFRKTKSVNESNVKLAGKTTASKPVGQQSGTLKSTTTNVAEVKPTTANIVTPKTVVAKDTTSKQTTVKATTVKVTTSKTTAPKTTSAKTTMAKPTIQKPSIKK